MAKKNDTTKDSPTKANGLALPAKQRNSPGKAKKAVPMRKKKQVLTIKCINFGPPFTFELYYYEKNSTEDGFTNGIVKYIRGNEQDVHEEFDNANFTQALQRRVALSADIVAKNPENNYDRKVFLRYPPDGESTPATRATGLLAMRSFLQDSRFSRYPPATIEMLDVTNFDSEKPAAMDEYIMNCDIQSLVVHDVQDTDLKSNFKAEFPECANCIWKSENVGDFGQSLGF